MFKIPPLLHYQPFKACYVGFSISRFLISLPIWTIDYILPSRRPVPTWTLTRALFVKALRFVTHVAFQVNSFHKRDLTLEATEKELKGTNATFVWVPPLRGEVKGKVGEWVNETGTEAVRLPAYWVGVEDAAGKRDYLAASDEKILLHFHGGAYIVGTAFPRDLTAYIPVQLTKVSSNIPRALMAEYRLSSSAPNVPLNPFPAALVDAISAYFYVLSKGFAPAHIFISGDSAGGNLVLALARYIVDNSLPTPGGLILFSPWVDLTGSHGGPVSSFVRNKGKDILLGSESAFGAYAVRSFAASIPATNPYISPACKTLVPAPSFLGFPRTYILAGGVELLLDEIRTLADRMKRQIDDVIYDEVPGTVHDFCSLGFAMDPERGEAIHRIAHWIDKGLIQEERRLEAQD